MLRDFYSELYGNGICSLNFHLLSHLCQHARQWGPLWQFSAFGYESMNGHLTSLIPSKYRVAEQLLFSIEVSQTLNQLEDRQRDTETPETLDFLSSTPCRAMISGRYLVGRTFSTQLSLEERRAMKNLTGVWPSVVSTFNEVYHNGTCFRTNKKENCKRDNSVCTFREQSREWFGVIVNCCLATEPIVIIREFNASGSFLNEIGTPCRATLQEYAQIDLLSSFIIRVGNYLPLIALPIHK